MADLGAKLLSRIENQQAVVGVIGLGYVGLPLIDAFTKAGFTCLGFDIDPKKVQSLSSGQSYIKHIASEQIAGWISDKHFSATTDMSRLSEPDVLVICVPTPLDEVFSKKDSASPKAS